MEGSESGGEEGVMGRAERVEGGGFVVLDGCGAGEGEGAEEPEGEEREWRRHGEDLSDGMEVE